MLGLTDGDFEGLVVGDVDGYVDGDTVGSVDDGWDVGRYVGSLDG
jgi:hypothetical protein